MTAVRPELEPSGTPQRAGAAGRVRGGLGVLRALGVAVRPRQWAKNGLVVGVPLAAGRLLDPAVARNTAVMVAALSLAASAGYLVNDVHDADEDRAHARKRRRPVASGALPVPVALAAAATLAGAGVAMAAVLGTGSALLVAGYLLLTTVYTLRLRSEPVLDLVVISGAFLLRGAAGGVASGIVVSSWFLLVAGAGSLFLVSGKRYSEFIGHPAGTGRRATLAHYSAEYLRFVWAASATVTIVAYALWAHEVYTVRQQGSWALWSLLPFLIGVLRYAHDVDRGRAEAPEELLLPDRTLQFVGLVWVLLLAAGAGGWHG